MHDPRHRARGRWRSRSVLAAAGLLTFLSVATAQDPPDEPVEHPGPLDNVGGAWVNLATFAVRPMVYDSDENLWVVNHHDSTVEKFSGVNTTPQAVYGVPWHPVAIGWWEGDGVSHDAELLVVCRGTWAVMGLDPATGTPTRLLQLRPGDPALPLGIDTRIGRMAEPGDILIDEANDRAFISCTGADSVVQIDLVSNTVVRVFEEDADSAFRVKSPLFLSFDHDGEDVLCAPLHSGNNSLALGNLQASTLVEDFSGLTSPEQGLPDEDLFRIHPYIDNTNQGSVEVVVKEMGTILFAHGIHPTTDDFWQLNTEANNKNPAQQTEPLVKGDIVENRISIVQNSGSTWGTAAGTPLVLDPGGLGGSITTANTVGQPFALCFDGDGYAYVAGLLTDNVVVLDSSGGYVMEIDLPDGSIPRGVLIHPSASALLVYCWGTNEVRGYNVSPATPSHNLRVVYELNHDPTPEDVAEGRVVFFDGSHSKEQNDSCASCHIEGGLDFQMWNLSNGPLEQKGPMFTQTLTGIARLAPFHWRGERQLIDFLPAFIGLLGAAPDDGDMTPEAGEEPSEEQFQAFERFVFSLNNPANPNQNRERLVDPDIHGPDTMFESGSFAPGHDSTRVGNAVTGIDDFADDAFVNVARHSCIDCHDYPMGTNNELNVEAESSNRPRRSTMKPAPFHESWRKHQSLVQIVRDEGTPGTPDLVTRVAAFLGSGFNHLGTSADLFRFVSVVVDVDSMSTDDDDVANNIHDLIHQWDQGLAPAVHFAYLLNGDNEASATTTAELDDYLHGQMGERNCDIAVLGTAKHPTSGLLVPRRWYWSRRVSRYVCEDPAFSVRTLAAFKDGAGDDDEVNVFLGLPLGMAERFAADYDMDGVRNLDATEIGYEYDPTQPGFDNMVNPGFASGGTPAFLWDTTKAARLVFDTQEPTIAKITYDESKTDPQIVYSPLLSKHHSVLLSGLRPSTASVDATDVGSYSAETVTYTVTVELTDATGNITSFTPYTVDTDPFIVPDGLVVPYEQVERRNMRATVVQDICMNQGGSDCDEYTTVSGKHQFKVDLTTAFKRGSWQLVGSDYERVRADDRIVVGRVFVQRANGDVETATSAGITVTPLAGTAYLVDRVRGTTATSYTQNLAGVFQPDGQYLAGLVLSGSGTFGAGQTAIEFEVDPSSGTGLSTGDRIIFNVEAVVETDPNVAPTLDTTTFPGETMVVYRTLWRGMWSEWSFPDTKEAQSSVTSATLP